MTFILANSDYFHSIHSQYHLSHSHYRSQSLHRSLYPSFNLSLLSVLPSLANSSVCSLTHSSYHFLTRSLNTHFVHCVLFVSLTYSFQFALCCSLLPFSAPPRSLPLKNNPKRTYKLLNVNMRSKVKLALFVNGTCTYATDDHRASMVLRCCRPKLQLMKNAVMEAHSGIRSVSCYSQKQYSHFEFNYFKMHGFRGI